MSQTTTAMPLAKRRRTDSEDSTATAGDSQTASATPVTRSHIWLSDGTIVLQAENTQFKVHQGYLARLSPIFADVFSVPQPVGETQPEVDGCPVLQLHDSAMDLTYALSEIYDHSYSARERIRIDPILAMIRIGRKYEIKHLLKEGIARIVAEFPSSLKGYDAIVDPSKWTGILDDDDHSGSEVLFKIANFCTKHSDMKPLLSVLPLVYYRANCRPVAEILAGKPSITDDAPSPTLLDPDVQRVCLLGREKLTEHYNVSFSWIDFINFEDPTGEYPHLRSCQQVIPPLMNAIWRPQPRLNLMLLPWDALEMFLNGVMQVTFSDVDDPYIGFKDYVCQMCYDEARASWRLGREKLWSGLPGHFGLPPWDVVNAEAGN